MSPVIVIHARCTEGLPSSDTLPRLTKHVSGCGIHTFGSRNSRFGARMSPSGRRALRSPTALQDKCTMCMNICYVIFYRSLHSGDDHSHPGTDSQRQLRCRPVRSADSTASLRCAPAAVLRSSNNLLTFDVNRCLHGCTWSASILKHARIQGDNPSFVARDHRPRVTRAGHHNDSGLFIELFFCAAR